MRLTRGESLQEAVDKLHLGEDGYTLRGLLTRFVAVCNTIAYAHSQGVLHRDLKPGNVMLGPYGETLVVDWGLAKSVDQASDDSDLPAPSHSVGETAATQMGQAVGTPQYMSPEQAAGQLDRLGPPSDVYSLGATLYCLLTGKAPLSDQPARCVGEILRLVTRGEIPRPRQIKPDIPRPLEAICLKA